VLGALAAAGCSSFRLDSMFAKEHSDAEPTGSISPPSAERTERASAAQLSEVDLAYARAAAVDVLARGGKDNNVPWRNPQTGVGGNITPLAASHSEAGLPCRDFLASYMRAGSQAWLQGSACRTSSGEWEVKSLKPLKSG
jgi:surface antigen